MSKYYDTYSIKKQLYEVLISPRDYSKKQALNKAVILKNGVPLGTWTGTDFEFTQLQRAVSSTQLSFSVIKHGTADHV